jgi:hypothetical protein
MSHSFKLDKTICKATTAAAADKHQDYWKSKTLAERMAAAYYLIKQAYGTDDNTRLDRTVISMRKQS